MIFVAWHTALRYLRVRPRFSLFLLGLVSSLAFAPVFWWGVFIPAFSGLLYSLSHAKTLKTAALRGWWFGFGQFIGGLWWLMWAFQYSAGDYGLWAAPPLVLALCAYLALFPALAAAGWQWTRRFIPAFLHPFSLAVCWVAAEMLRGVGTFSFPWNLVGYGFAGNPLTMQLAAWGGVWGLSLVAVLAGCAFTRKSAFAVAVLVLALVYGVGYARLPHTPSPTLPLTVQLVQGNIEQDVKWQPHTRQLVVTRYLALSDPKADLIVWPETAVPYLYDMAPGLFQHIARTLAPAQVVTGLPWRAWQGNTPVFTNALGVLSQDGEPQRYDKRILVPFGEFVPLRAYLPGFIQKLAAGPSDYTPGHGTPHLKLPRVGTILPLICYEAIYPWHVARYAQDATLLLNVTNDAWFGITPGPFQHFAMARMRAVETGLPLLRVANTGITATIDGYGRITGEVKMYHTDTLRRLIPQHTYQKTFFTNHLTPR